MKHGGDLYQKNIVYDFSVSLNPFAPKERLMEAGMRGISGSGRYPDLLQREIRVRIAEAEGVSADCVLAGNGASELLTGVVRFVNPKTVLLFEPGYSGYAYAAATIRDCEIIRYKTKEVNHFLPTVSDLEEVLTAGKKPDLLFLCNPWNPGGKLFEENDLINILALADGEGIYTVLDESFLMLSEGFLVESTTSVGELIKRFPKVTVLKSFTKFLALPGVRMGYIAGTEEVVCGIQKTLPEWNLSVPAEALLEEGILLTQDKACMQSMIEKIKEERIFLEEELKKLGMKVFESDSCFIYFSSEKEIAKALLEKGILIRNYEEDSGTDGHYYRIGVKDAEANRILVEAIKEIIRGN